MLPRRRRSQKETGEGVAARRRWRQRGKRLREAVSAGRRAEAPHVGADTAILAPELERVTPLEVRNRRVGRLRHVRGAVRTAVAQPVVARDVDRGKRVERHGVHEVRREAERCGVELGIVAAKVLEAVVSVAHRNGGARRRHEDVVQCEEIDGPEQQARVGISRNGPVRTVERRPGLLRVLMGVHPCHRPRRPSSADRSSASPGSADRRRASLDR